jgi:hypothetical protein
MRRRDVLVIGGAAAMAIATPPLLRRLPSRFDFEPLPGFDGFRRLVGGPTTGGVDPFFGLGDRMPVPSDPEPELPKSPCTALFGSEGWAGDTVPVAIFSDFFCPYCRDFESRLLALETSGAPIRLTWHEMPLLGDGSYRAARAVLAAALMGRERAARAYLWAHPLPPGPVGLRRLAAALDVHPESLIRANSDRRVATALAESLRLGGDLGIFGTPATVVGRTLVIGAIKDADLKKLITLEQEESRTVCL